MKAETIAKKLNQNVYVVEKTFLKNNLEVISYGFCEIDEDDGWMDMLIEVSSISGDSINDSVYVTANFYNADNNIIYTDDVRIDKERFLGHDTLRLYLQEYNLAFKTEKCRIYATKTE